MQVTMEYAIEWSWYCYYDFWANGWTDSEQPRSMYDKLLDHCVEHGIPQHPSFITSQNPDW